MRTSLWAVRVGPMIRVWPGDRQKPRCQTGLRSRSWAGERRKRWYRWGSLSAQGRGRPMGGSVSWCVDGLKRVGIDLRSVPSNVPFRLHIDIQIEEAE